MKALLIVNPVSGRMVITEYVNDIRSFLKKKGFSVRTFTTRSKDDARLFAEQYGGDAEMIVCCGGDGTLSEIVNGIVDLPNHPIIGYIPTGTTNDFAKNIGLNTDILKSVIHLSHGVVREMDVGCFGKKYFVYVASFGLFARSSYATPRALKRRFGHVAYMLTGIKELVKPKSYRITLSDDRGNMYTGDYIYGSVSNSTSIGGLLHFDKGEVDLQDGLHEVVLIRRPKNLLEFHHAIRAVFSGKYDSDLITIFSASKVTIQSTVPIDWSLDGEHARTRRFVTIRNVPRAVRIVFPQTGGIPQKNNGNILTTRKNIL